MYELRSGHLLLVDAGVSVDIEAIGEADLLLSISMYHEEQSVAALNGS